MKDTKTIKKDGQNTKSSRTENILQASCVEWFKNNYCLKHHKPRYDIFSVPNEATWNNNNFKATGVRNGVSDLVIVLNKKVIFVELKDGNNNQSEHQIDFEKVVTELNHEYFVIRSLDQFKTLICHHLNKQSAQ